MISTVPSYLPASGQLRRGARVRRPELLWKLAVVLAMVLVAGCAAQAPSRKPAVYDRTGIASYYGREFHGRMTASGQRYVENAFTAAHRFLPFGTRVRVVNLKNGRNVTVRINDRGPFVKGRIIDLSYAAARKLKMLADGIVRVRVVQLP